MGLVYTAGSALSSPFCHDTVDLADLYHDRWGIEELYKTSKLGFELENFHIRSERGVKQEIFAHFNLIAMTRLFTNFGDAMHNTQSPPDRRGRSAGCPAPRRTDPSVRVNALGSCLGCGRHETADPAMGAGS